MSKREPGERKLLRGSVCFLPAEWKELKHLARVRQVSVNWIVGTCVARTLPRLQEEEAAAQWRKT